ncbi:MAG: hypothetical protein U0105_09375 [Candidatus Obscuribacterales bacterium]
MKFFELTSATLFAMVALSVTITQPAHAQYYGYGNGFDSGYNNTPVNTGIPGDPTIGAMDQQSHQAFEAQISAAINNLNVRVAQLQATSPAAAASLRAQVDQLTNMRNAYAVNRYTPTEAQELMNMASSIGASIGNASIAQPYTVQPYINQYGVNRSNIFRRPYGGLNRRPWF